MDNKAIIKSITTISEALKTASDELNQLAGMLEERDKNTPTIADEVKQIIEEINRRTRIPFHPDI